MGIQNPMCIRRNVVPSSHDRHAGSGHPRDGNRVTGHVYGTSLQAGQVQGGVHISTVAPPAAVPVPRQLPPPPNVYVDREEQLAEIGAAVSRAHARGRNALIVITGPAGVGKSSLAAHFLHEREDLGDQGQLYADLQGYTRPGPPTDPQEVLEFLLLSVGADLKSVPADLSTRAAWWRSATAGKRMVLLIDNALSAAQVRTLLPGGSLNTVVVTSRTRLAGLRLHGADFVSVPLLLGDDGAELLARLSDRDPRSDDERAAMRRIVDLCSGLPVAMCAVAVGENAYGSGSWARVEHDLHDSEARLARLNRISEQLDEETSVRGAFDVSYALLDPAQARLYRRLSWHRGPDLTAPIASCLGSCSEEEARSLLTALARQAMLFEHAPGRYRFHDLLRLHATGKAREEESAQEQRDATERLLSTFGDLSAGADALLRPYAGTAPPSGTPFTGPAEATAWLNSERENLAALTGHAVASGHHAQALRLFEGLWPLFLHHGHASLWLRAAPPAFEAARALHDQRCEGRLLNKRALVLSHLARVDAAIVDLDAAEDIWHERGDLERIAQTRQRRGILAFQNGRAEEAVTYLLSALNADERTGAEHNKAITLSTLGRAQLATGAPEEARRSLECALPLLHGDTYNQARTRTALGSVLTALEQPGAARRHLESALAVMRERGSVSGQGKALEALGDLAETQGDTEGARESYARALDLLLPNDPARGRVELRLTELGRR